MVTIDKVKIIVIGDSGVGKTSLTHLISKREPISRPLWTVGCTVDVMLHEYREGTPYQKPYFIELWDIGGSASHKNSSHVFYSGVNGIILVHDVTNKKSFENLQKWLAEVLNKGNQLKPSKTNDFDSEQYAGYTQIPTLIIGTKAGMVGEKRSRNTPSFRTNKFSEECGADEIFLDCLHIRSLAPGTGSSVKLAKFFDKVISGRYHSNTRDREKRKKSTFPPGTKYFHGD